MGLPNDGSENLVKHLGFILFAIGGLAFFLYVIFHQLATEYLDLPMAVAMFLVVCALLLLSLASGFFAISLIALPVSTKRRRIKEAKNTKWLFVCSRTEKSIHIWPILVLTEIRRVSTWLMAGPLPRTRKSGDISSMRLCVRTIAWCVVLVSHPAPSTYSMSMWTRSQW